MTKDIKQLFDSFWSAYKTLRGEWLKTGGGMDMQIQIRDAGAEIEFQRRSTAAKKVAAKRKAKSRRAAEPHTGEAMSDFQDGPRDD